MREEPHRLTLPRIKRDTEAFASYDAAHTVLTAAGFSPTGRPAHVPGEHGAQAAVRFAHPDGSRVVLAHRLAEPPGDDAGGPWLAAVGG